jgi:hypothetical protein
MSEKLNSESGIIERKSNLVQYPLSLFEEQVFRQNVHDLQKKWKTSFVINNDKAEITLIGRLKYLKQADLAL